MHHQQSGVGEGLRSTSAIYGLYGLYYDHAKTVKIVLVASIPQSFATAKAFECLS